MASENHQIPCTCYDTALAILPPEDFLKPDLQNLRDLYDHNHEKWPPHLTLLFPFVDVSMLETAKTVLTTWTSEHAEDDAFPATRSFQLKLDTAATFEKRNYSVIYIGPRETSDGAETTSWTRLQILMRELSKLFKFSSNRPYHPHLTVGRTDGKTESTAKLLAKAQKLVELDNDGFLVKLIILQRDSQKVMRKIAEIKLTTDESAAADLGGPCRENASSANQTLRFASREQSWQFSSVSREWEPCQGAPLPEPASSHLSISTYNLLDTDMPHNDIRFPRLLKSILALPRPSPHQPSVLALQEVNDELLTFLLSDPRVQNRWPFSTHSPDRPLRNARNSVVLSSTPFGEWELVGLGRRHKTACVLHFPGVKGYEESSSVVVANVHLTAGLTDDAIAAKATQMRVLHNHLEERFGNSDWIILGDFNVATDSSRIRDAVENGKISRESEKIIKDHIIDKQLFTDCWAEFHGWTHGDEDSDAVTVEPGRNALAAHRDPDGVAGRGSRYDRVLVKRSGKLETRDIKKFGFASSVEEVGSDHWGLSALLQFPEPRESAVASSNQINLLLETKFNGQSPEELEDFVRSHASYPSQEDKAAREHVVVVLRAILCHPDTVSSRPAFPLVLVPVGSTAFQVFDKSSDLDCICVSNISAETFFCYAIQQIRKFGSPDIRILRVVKAAMPILELRVKGFKVDLQHCKATSELLELWDQIGTMDPGDQLFKLPADSLKKLNAYRDFLSLENSIPSLETFRIAYRFLKIWAVARGIHGSKFGLLGGFQLVIMLIRVQKLISKQRCKEVTAADVVRNFFRYYGDLDWSLNIISDPDSNIRYHRMHRDAACIVNVNAPAINVAQKTSMVTLNTMVEEFKIASHALEFEEATWPSICRDGAHTFLNSFKDFLKIELLYWGLDVSRARALKGWIESRMVRAFVELGNRVPSAKARVWPCAFRNLADNAQLVSDAESIDVFYLIGLAPVAATEVHALTDMCRDFERMIQDSENLDNSVSAVMIGRRSHAELMNDHPVLDEREWPHDEDLSSLENLLLELGMEEKNVSELPVRAATPVAGIQSQRAPLSISRVTKPSSSSPSSKGPSLRTSTDVLNRMRHDPAKWPLKDHMIGYMDRLDGLKEMLAKDWPDRDITSETFIPMHRIIYFKRISDNVIVWDREKKVDLVFGSGMTGQERRKMECTDEDSRKLPQENRKQRRARTANEWELGEKRGAANGSASASCSSMWDGS